MLETQIIGNVGRDAEVKQSRSGDRKFIVFSVCHTETWKDKDGVKHEKSQWVEVISNQENLAQYIKKGDKIFVKGSPSIDAWVDKSDASKANSTFKLSADQIVLLTSKPTQA